MRTCNLCGAQGEEGVEFYKGVTSRCSECHRRRVRENRAEKFQQYKAYEARRYKENPRRKEAIDAYAQTEAGKTAAKKARAKWLSENGHKRSAHILVQCAVKRGDIKKPNKCEECGMTGGIGKWLHAHHQDYTKPLSVEWLCKFCHAKSHQR